MLVFTNKLNKWHGFESPANSTIFAFSICNPSSSDYSTRFYLNFSRFYKIYTFKMSIFIKNLFCYYLMNYIDILLINM